MTGIGAGVGIATGLQAGACLTAEAAKEQGYITSEQVEDLLRPQAGRLLPQTRRQSPARRLAMPECAEVIARLKAASSQ